MSSPNRRQQSATPRRSGRHADASTPRQPRQPSQLVSSPLFYQSSPAPAAGDGADEPMADVSSPLRQMTNSQSTHVTNGHAPSSPLRQMTDTQSVGGDDQRTPRASGGLAGGMDGPVAAFCFMAGSVRRRVCVLRDPADIMP